MYRVFHRWEAFHANAYLPYVAWRRKNPLRHLCLQPGGFFLQGNLHQYGNDAVPMACPQWSGSGRRRLNGKNDQRKSICHVLCQGVPHADCQGGAEGAQPGRGAESHRMADGVYRWAAGRTAGFGYHLRRLLPQRPGAEPCKETDQMPWVFL